MREKTYDVELDELNDVEQEALADLREALEAARDELAEARTPAAELLDEAVTSAGVQRLLDLEGEIEELLDELPNREEEVTDAMAVGV